VRGASRRAFDAVNVDGTAALLDAMAAAAPKARLLHVSTLAAAQPQLSDYAASKRSAELLVTTRGQSGDLILRPTAVYGPGDRELKPLLDQAMKGMLPRPVGNRRVSLLHIDDLVDALLLAMRTTPGEAGPYPLADARAQGYRWREIAAAAARLRGDRVRVFPVPKTLLYLLSLGTTLSAKALGDDPMLTPGKVRELTFEDWSCDSSAFRARTGWTPQISLDAGLRSLYP
jgi:nucleoside-diphosphate-sugar epimerase